MVAAAAVQAGDLPHVERVIVIEFLDRGEDLLEVAEHRLGPADAGEVVGTAVVHEHGGDLGHELLVRLDVGGRAEQALLLAAPDHEPDGPPRLRAGLHEDAGGFKRRGDARAVIGRAGGAIPRVDVAADDHVFIGQLDARDIGDHVVERDRALLEVVADVELEGDGLAVLEPGGDFLELLAQRG